MSLAGEVAREQGAHIPAAHGRWRVAVTARFETFADFWPRAIQPEDAIFHIFQSAEFLEVWLDTIGRARGISPCFCAVLAPNGDPLMLLALGIERRGSTRVLSFLDGGASDYNAPVLFAATPEWEAEEARELLSDILSALPAFDVIEFEKMPATVLARSNPLLHLGAEPWPCEGHAASTAPTWEAFSASRIKHSKRFERYRRQLARSAPLSYVIAEAADWQGSFKALIAQKEARFVETRVPGFSERPGMIDFYREMTRRYIGSGLVHLSAVASGEQAIAAQWGLRQGGRYYYLICGYEAGAWEKYSPGRLITEAMLKWCHGSGLAVADFGIGDEPYKYQYCDRHLLLYGTVKPVSLLGWIYATRLRVLAWLRSRPLWQALRPYKWIVLRALKRSSPGRPQ